MEAKIQYVTIMHDISEEKITRQGTRDKELGLACF